MASHRRSTLSRLVEALVLPLWQKLRCCRLTTVCTTTARWRVLRTMRMLPMVLESVFGSNLLCLLGTVGVGRSKEAMLSVVVQGINTTTSRSMVHSLGRGRMHHTALRHNTMLVVVVVTLVTEMKVVTTTTVNTAVVHQFVKVEVAGVAVTETGAERVMTIRPLVLRPIARVTTDGGVLVGMETPIQGTVAVVAALVATTTTTLTRIVTHHRGDALSAGGMVGASTSSTMTRPRV
jgi:hypothetical protein